VVEGVTEVVRELGAIQEMVSRLNDKYSSDITVEFMDPDVNATFRVRRAGCSASTTRSSRVPDSLAVLSLLNPAREGRPPTGSRRTARPGGPSASSSSNCSITPSTGSP
jgi:hypothetical protein